MGCCQRQIQLWPFSRGNILQFPTAITRLLIILTSFTLAIIMRRSLQERAKNLTSISLEAFINDATSEGENYAFAGLLTHPNIHTAKPHFQELLRLFSQGNYIDYPNGKFKGFELSDRQVHTLRRLTLLSLFKGSKTVLMSRLREALGMGEEGVIDMLLGMNISNLASVKIDEEGGRVAILGAEIRAGVEREERAVLSGKIAQIMKRNAQIEQSIVSLQTNIR